MYSQQLRSEVERLETEKLVTESEVHGANVSFLLEKTGDLEALVKDIGHEKEPAWAEIARHLNLLSPGELEGVSTILFLRECGYSGDGLKERLFGLKPHLERIYDRCETEASKLSDFRLACLAA
jgi:hypothetical protein